MSRRSGPRRRSNGTPTTPPLRRGWPSTVTQTSRPSHGPILVALLVAALVFLPTSVATRNGYVELDDQLYLENHPPAQGLTSEAVVFAFTSIRELCWHPLTWLSHGLDVEIFGSAPAGHHLTSVLLHALAAGLLCLLLIRLGAGTSTAAVGSLLWALHPLRVESFAWLAERKDVLCALFFLSAITAYLRYLERPSRTRYAAWLSLGGGQDLHLRPGHALAPNRP